MRVAGAVALLALACGESPSRLAGVVVAQGECHQLLRLQCECCAEETYCLDYVDDLVGSGEARTDSSELECAARRAEATDVDAWCTATFTSQEAQRRACQGFTYQQAPDVTQSDAD